jgi:hypothetical protein
MDRLTAVSFVSLGVAALCAIAVALDVALTRRQHMAIMNIVWPLTALYAGPIAIAAYLWFGRAPKALGDAPRAKGHAHGSGRRPLWQSVALGTTHCGAGCTLGDIVAENVVVVLPLTLFGRAVYGTWALDFALAFIFGIAFQFFAIRAMRGGSIAATLAAALKADALSLTAWQVGMYAFMAIAIFVLLPPDVAKSDPRFWFMMQVAMLAGFATSYPVNAWLIRRGWKERM